MCIRDSLTVEGPLVRTGGSLCDPGDIFGDFRAAPGRVSDIAADFICRRRLFLDAAGNGVLNIIEDVYKRQTQALGRTLYFRFKSW